MIKVGGAVIASHAEEYAFGWEDATGPVRIPAASKEDAEILAHRAGGKVYVRLYFETAWEEA